MSLLECDLVMRGGITSGVVYPKAVARLAQSYRFRSIGGTSAGAIAAVVTAAAEYRRQRGAGDSFAGRVEGLPEEMGKVGASGCSRLQELFQPLPETARLLDLLLASLKKPRWWHLPVALLRGFPLGAMAGALAGLLMLAAAAAVGSGLGALLLVVGLVVTLVGSLLGAGLGAAATASRVLPRHGYGICSGRGVGSATALTDWLHALIQDCAGRSADDPPLTFGDLWAPNGGAPEPGHPREIDLTLITTNVTQGLPHRFPFLERSSREPLFFRRGEFEHLFPPTVVQWLCDHPSRRAINGGPVVVPEGMHPLPAAQDLPILLGARFSLSFPFLLSAVPLWTPDLPSDNDGPRPWRCCLFSDGGLTSNFPIHVFDAPIPGRPTFCINLKSANVQVVEGNLRKSRDVWLPAHNGEGVVADFLHVDKGSLLAFFSSLFDTARNWSDSELATMPGYRERIVHVHLSDQEGGMNLDMGADAIARLGGLGEKAAALLSEGFDPNVQKGGLDSQRWVRLRSTLAALEVTVRSFAARWDQSGYDRLFDDPPDRYPWKSTVQREHARTVVDSIRKLAESFDDDADRTMDIRAARSVPGRSPRPKPVLRMMPPGSRDPRVERTC